MKVRMMCVLMFLLAIEAGQAHGHVIVEGVLWLLTGVVCSLRDGMIRAERE